MSEADRARWDSKYAGRTSEAAPACEVLSAHHYLLPPSGAALDLACGLGGNARLLAAHGLETLAWDIAPNAIDALNTLHLPRLHAEVRDVCVAPPPPDSFDVIVVSRFLDRALCPAIAAALRPDGLLFYQTFVREAVNDHGPRNPAYRLAPGELLALFADLRPLHYSDLGTTGDTTKGIRDQAWLVATRRT